ncbi:ScbA/BarX family gamma-butyrolactone biosynthesis protein [Nocardia sp. XZ_19_385]|uniref:ScbA/BarX family gamma-butyrolactone biosynthesis protein n=1 Tax=Nocardia sp. XZ_19_385 TaxID=2769488 RepID=UPI00188EDB6A|nr:ScbA/BarX family gamma-butyrolactone biosynthesis protein [Nocardia sp. XZ_19_385]
MTQTSAVTATHLRTISRVLAHRCAVSEVFVTSLDRLGPNEFQAGAQLPRMHAYYSDHAGPLGLRHDPLVVMEAARQAAIASTHEFFGVPPEMAFIVRTFNGTGSDTDVWETCTAPADLVMNVRVSAQHRRGGVPHGLDLVLEIACDGAPMMTVDGSFSWTTASRWNAMRSAFRDSLGLGQFRGSGALSERAPEALVGRENRRNVVIGPPRLEGRTARAALVADLAHPFLFDHQLDHIPGSLLIEAARQTALTLLPELPRLLSVGSTFERFVELDCPAECVAEIIESEVGPTVVRCVIEQAGAEAARIDLEFGADAVVSEPDGKP